MCITRFFQGPPTSTTALEDVQLLEGIAEENASLAWISMAHQARGRYCLTAGKLEEAGAAWGMALDAFAKYGNVYEVARCKNGLAQCLAEKDPERALLLGQEAHQTLQTLRKTGSKAAPDTDPTH